jgi:hypothetical protein
VFVDDKYCYDNSSWENFRWPNWISSIDYCDKIKLWFNLEKIKSYKYKELEYWFYKILWNKKH